MGVDGAAAIAEVVGLAAFDIAMLRDDRVEGLADLDLGLAKVLNVQHAGEAPSSRDLFVLLSRKCVASLRVVVAARVTGIAIVEIFAGHRRSEAAIAADVAGGDALSTEDGRRDEVEDTKGEGEDASRKDQSPHGEAKLWETVCGLDEVTQDSAADNNHGGAEPCERVRWAQDGPVSLKVKLKETELGDGQEDGDGEVEEVRDGIEKEEVSVESGEDNHGPAGYHDQGEADDIESAEGVEDQVAGAPNLGILAKLEHCEVFRDDYSNDRRKQRGSYRSSKNLAK